MERIRNQFDLSVVFYFESKNCYTGSKGKLRFRIDVKDGQILCAIWREDICFELAEIEKTAAFPLDAAGYDQMIAFLDQAYADTPK